MAQGRLYKVIQDMMRKDTGTNVHRLYVTCDLGYIMDAWRMAREGPTDRRQLKVTRIPDGYTIEIYRPTPKDTNITILK